MKNQSKLKFAGNRWMPLIVVAAIAVTAAVVWGGISSVGTLARVAAESASSGKAQSGLAAGGRPGTVWSAESRHHAGPSGSVPAPDGKPRPNPTAGEAALPANGTKSAEKGLGNSPETSLEEAASAEVGLAAGLKPDAPDNSSNLIQRGPISPADVLANANVSLGGCLPQYGAAGQCLPAVPPSQSHHLKDMKDAGLDPSSMKHTWACAEVREYFKTGISVRQANVDPQKLDANKDGIGCGPDD